jgi:hypothetical protein
MEERRGPTAFEIEGTLGQVRTVDASVTDLKQFGIVINHRDRLSVSTGSKMDQPVRSIKIIEQGVPGCPFEEVNGIENFVLIITVFD